ncbi:hypothetical protein DNI29_12160 [Hymenobacter sediminis]|nr:hypothetical protein DNI29_12160 [Hymenobacter sediminis]
MCEYWQQGFRLVIGNRQDRQEGLFAILSARLFHGLMPRFALLNILPGGFDYVLFDRQVQERNNNVFYLMTWLGYPYVNIPHSRRSREIGASRWTLAKKIKLLNSFLSFSFFHLGYFRYWYLLGRGSAALLTISGGSTSKRYSQPAGWNMLMVVLLFVSNF